MLKVIRAVDAQLGNTAQVQRASTDANIPLSLGREAIAIGGGGTGGGAHTLQEWFDCHWKGTWTAANSAYNARHCREGATENDDGELE